MNTLAALVLGLVINGHSYHHPNDKDFNEKNYGLGVTYEYNPGREIQFGRYHNSDYNQTNYLFHKWFTKYHLGHGYHVSPGIIAGVGTGYTDGLAGAIIPTVSVGYEKAQINFLATYEPGGKHFVFGLQFQYNLVSD